MEFLKKYNFFNSDKFIKYFNEENYIDHSFSKFRKVYEYDQKIIKIARLGEIDREIIGLKILGEKELSPKLIDYFKWNGFQIIIMEKVEGVNLIDEYYLDNSEKFIKKYAEAIYKLHHKVILKGEEIKKINSISYDFLEEINTNYKNNKIAPWMLEKVYDTSIEEGISYLNKNYHKLEQDTVIHGDVCLPNIIFKDGDFFKFIDFDRFGIFDYHYDIFWAIWTLELNLKTDKYAERFIEYYGKDLIDEERLKICGLISCLLEIKDMEKLD